MKSTYIGIGAVVVIGALVFFALQKNKQTGEDATAGFSRTIMEPNQHNDIQSQQHTTTMNEQITELKTEDIVVGTGAEAKAGDKVTVQYVGQLTNGTVFDASRNHGDQGFTFTLGAGQVIQGWDMGVAGMKEGGKRKLSIPSNLAYGNMEVGGGLIPANSPLIFEVELVKVSK